MTPNMARAWFLLAMVTEGTTVALAVVSAFPLSTIFFVATAAVAAYFSGGFLRLAEDAS